MDTNEDSIIVDPFLSSVLNAKREVQIGDKIYRYIRQGLVTYNASEVDKIDQILSKLDTSLISNLFHGDKVSINNNVDFYKIEYADAPVIEDVVLTKSPGPRPSGVVLGDGLFIPDSKIKRTTYSKGKGDANWFQRTISGKFGTNVTLENYYSKSSRMKLRMYDQDYLIYRAIGMTVRMQEKTLGIWWRKKAQEFRYGWTAIECQYEYSNPVFPEPKKNQDGTYNHPKYPFAMVKKFPFSDTEIVLFNIPFINYDITSADVNKVVENGFKQIAKNMGAWLNTSFGQKYKNNPRGLYSTHSNDKKVIITYPQGEDVAYNDGREVVRWDLTWFSGKFIVSFTNNMMGGPWNTSFDIGKATDVKIVRGRIYAAVKYKNEWRACIIESV